MFSAQVSERITMLIAGYLEHLPGSEKKKEWSSAVVERWKKGAEEAWDNITALMPLDPGETAGSMEKRQVDFAAGYIAAKNDVLMRHNLAL